MRSKYYTLVLVLVLMPLYTPRSEAVGVLDRRDALDLMHGRSRMTIEAVGGGG